ncbi:MAG: hypothetical protein ACE5JU_08025 [Candidatus Binatia bacterium]
MASPTLTQLQVYGEVGVFEEAIRRVMDLAGRQVRTTPVADGIIGKGLGQLLEGIDGVRLYRLSQSV